MLTEASACPLRARSAGQRQELTVTPGQSEIPAHLRAGWLTRYAHRPSKQRVSPVTAARRSWARDRRRQIERAQVILEVHGQVLTSCRFCTHAPPGRQCGMARDDSRTQVQLDEDTLARRRRVLGDDHPETMSSAAFDLILRGLASVASPNGFPRSGKPGRGPGVERRRTWMKE